MKKLLSILSAVVLTSTTSTGVIACGGEKPIPTVKTDLNIIVTNKNLDDIYVGQSEQPNKTEILNAIKNKNTTALALTVNDFEFKTDSITKLGATIVGTNNYTGKVNITYTCNNFIAKAGTHGLIWSLATDDKNGNIYAAGGDNNIGTVYKSDGTNSFTAMTGISDKIYSLATDKDGNVYAGSGNGTVYKSDIN